jgi:hypothetical protein
MTYTGHRAGLADIIIRRKLSVFSFSLLAPCGDLIWQSSSLAAFALSSKYIRIGSQIGRFRSSIDGKCERVVPLHHEL